MGRALLVGIDHYDFITPGLHRSVSGARAMEKVLAFHANNDANYSCRVLAGTDPSSEDVGDRVIFNSLRAAIAELFAYDGPVVFYFSGHGITRNGKTYLATQDGNPDLPGVKMDDIFQMANASSASEVLILLDCCYAGALGEPSEADSQAEANPYFRDGVTLIAAARYNQTALAVDKHGVFTNLLLGALEGGAADARGRVSAASLYAYVEQALGPWDQRPVYKSNASRLTPIRLCTPDIEDAELRKLPLYFQQPDEKYRMDRTYEVTTPEALPQHIAIFDLFKRYQVARLLRPTMDDHLYFTAIHSRTVELTPLGRFYWQQAKAGRLGSISEVNGSRRQAVPDAEELAKAFHETYERLAPYFNYETRQATRKAWEEIPEDNKRLMIAVAAEIIAKFFVPFEEEPPTALPEAQ